MKSWDCFDTLIGRSFYYPISIFEIVSKLIQDPLFVTKRVEAEKKSKLKTYNDIYKYLPEYDPELEIDVEKQYSFPIVENFNRVEDGDIIISDMYFSASQIRDLLEYHGLQKNVQIYVTYSGKHTGQSWNWLNHHFPNLDYHCGDNIFSDVKMCRKYGIKSLFFGGSKFTPEEEFLNARGNIGLAALMRRSRLSNPYSRPRSIFMHDSGSFQNIAGHYWIEEINGSINTFYTYAASHRCSLLQNLKNRLYIKIYYENSEVYLTKNLDDPFELLYRGYWIPEKINYINQDQRLFWIDQSQFNIPILILYMLSLPVDRRILFSQRDCYYLAKIYNTFFNTNYEMLDVSRRGYYNPFNEKYIDYILSSTKDAIIVDAHGSGNSSSYFFNKHQKKCPEIFHICRHPSIVSNCLIDNQNAVLISSLCSESFFCNGRSLEKYNVQYLGQMKDWIDGIAIRRRPEHNKIICTTIKECIDNLCKYIVTYKDLIQPDIDAIPSLLNKLKGTFTDQMVKTIGA